MLFFLGPFSNKKTCGRRSALFFFEDAGARYGVGGKFRAKMVTKGHHKIVSTFYRPRISGKKGHEKVHKIVSTFYRPRISGKKGHEKVHKIVSTFY